MVSHIGLCILTASYRGRLSTDCCIAHMQLCSATLHAGISSLPIDGSNLARAVESQLRRKDWVLDRAMVHVQHDHLAVRAFKLLAVDCISST